MPPCFLNYVTCFLSACYAGLRLDRPDVVVALTDPPIIGLAAYLASRRFGVPLVISYRDIIPEVARLLEDFQSRTVERVLEAVNRFLCRRADRVVALGETMRQRLIDGKGADPARTVVIPDWADCAEIAPGPRRSAFSLAHGLADRFVVMHSGNMGLSQGLEHVIQAAARLRGLPDLGFVFIGDGLKRPALQEQARRLGLPNVLFLPYQPKERLGEVFEASGFGLKRAFDAALAGVGLIVSVPLWILIALGIKLEDGGPATTKNGALILIWPAAANSSTRACIS